MLEISKDRKNLKVIYACYHVFGSGSGSVSVKIEGKTLDLSMIKEKGWGSKGVGDNGFVGWYGAIIPLDQVRKMKEVKLYESYYPGSTRRYKGSGSSIIKRAAPNAGPDPLEITRSNIPRLRYIDKLRASKVHKIAETFSGRPPTISGGGQVPPHFYHLGGRWEVPQHNRDFRTETIVQEWTIGLGYCCDMILAKFEDTVFAAPRKIQSRMEKEVGRAIFG